MQMIDIYKSLIATLMLMLVCNYFCLGLFSSILLMILAFLVLNYSGRFRIFRKNVNKNVSDVDKYYE